MKFQNKRQYCLIFSKEIKGIVRTFSTFIIDRSIIKGDVLDAATAIAKSQSPRRAYRRLVLNWAGSDATSGTTEIIFAPPPLLRDINATPKCSIRFGNDDGERFG